MRILLVEDDPTQLEPLQKALSRALHVVDGIKDSHDAQWLIAQKEYDLLILDWMLPRVSGISLCRQYRAAGKTSPVLILTAKDAIPDRVTGLDAGADDYLVKPFSVVELLARVRALARRSPLWNGDTLDLADLKLHLDNLTLERQGNIIQLSKREFQLLEYFLRHPNRILTHAQIEHALWEWDTEPESNALSKLVRRLRHRLDSIGAADWVESVYGVGYRLRAQEDVCSAAAAAT
ncbi:MAG: response regulator transcription factor [Leptolyngbyaceae cyanobacterium RM1_406_9]|nr:response regulator transcription factor [Leptolyngbyaceae cyanobacterium RM1_406_9]